MSVDEEIKDALCNNDQAFLLTALNNGLDIDHRFIDEDNDTLLHYALSDKGSAIYQFLLEQGPDYKVINDEGESLLHSIVFSGDSKRLYALLDKTQLNLNGKNNDGATALLLSIVFDEKDIFHALISLGADVNAVDNAGFGPIHMAAQSGDLDMVRTLIENGANIFLKTSYGNLPLALAINNNNKPVVRYLFEKMDY